MSVSFMWEVVKPERAKAFCHGTSSDIETLRETFGDTVTSSHIHTLRAMHRATQLKESLWSEIADKLDSLQGDDPTMVTIKVWTEF